MKEKPSAKLQKLATWLSDGDCAEDALQRFQSLMVEMKARGLDEATIAKVAIDIGDEWEWGWGYYSGQGGDDAGLDPEIMRSLQKPFGFEYSQTGYYEGRKIAFELEMSQFKPYLEQRKGELRIILREER